jgi:hypothetical protein
MFERGYGVALTGRVALRSRIGATGQQQRHGRRRDGAFADSLDKPPPGLDLSVGRFILMRRCLGVFLICHLDLPLK